MRRPRRPGDGQGDGVAAYRCWLLKQFRQAIAEEVVPAIRGLRWAEAVIVAGASIGAFNAWRVWR